MKNLILPLTTFFAIGCSNLQVHENQKNQASATQATSDAGQQLQLLRNQVEIQKNVLRLSQQNPPANWTKNKPLAQAHLSESQNQLKELEARFRSLRETTGSYSAYAHAHPRVLSNEPGWAQAEEWRKRLQMETQAFNRQLQTTTNSVNAGNQVFTQTGLFKKRSSQDLAVNLQANTEGWRGTYNQLANRFGRAQESAPNESSVAHLQTIQKNMKELEELIRGIDKLKATFQNQLGGRGEITNLDADWIELEKMAKRRDQLRGEWENAVSRTEQSFDRFNRALAGSATNP